MFEPRGYRQSMRPEGLVCFTVVVEQTDLMVMAESDLSEATSTLVRQARELIASHIAAYPAFAASLDPLAPPPRGDISGLVESMYRAGALAGTGPMAAVAGAVAEYVGAGLLEFSGEVIVENGGDLYIATRMRRVVSIYAGRSKLNMRVGLRVGPGESGVCTSSGTVGHSYSRGRADAAVAVSSDTALADAVATELGNRVQRSADIDEALAWVRSVDGIVHAAVICDDTFGTWGELEIVPVGETGRP